MTTLSLGVVDVAYSDEAGKLTTTGDVAKILEDNYGVMAKFFELHQNEIADAMANAVAGEIESLMMGIKPGGFGPTDNPVTQGNSVEKANKLLKSAAEDNYALSRVEAMFRNYLDDGEYERATGTVIAAARSGVNHRKKHAYVKANPSRPAFVDTRLYQASFRAWIK